MGKLTKFLLLGLSILTLFIYISTSAGRTPYDYFTRLAESFIKGKYWLSENPSWLNELVPSPGGRYYTVYPPMPAILEIIPVLVFGDRFEQQWFAHILGIGVGLIVANIAYKISRKNSIAIWGFLLCTLGSINWYMSATGSVWLLGQITAEFFLTLAIAETLGRKRIFLIGTLLGMAYLSRLQTIMALPSFVILLWRDFKKSGTGIRLDIRKLGLLVIPLSICILLNFGYNYIRYQTIFDVGYVKIPGVLQEPWYSKGLFNPGYITNHLQVMLLSFPNIFSRFPYIQPSWAGLAIWITTPPIVFILFSKIKDRLVVASWLGIVLTGLVNFSHGGTGFAQFGYRYAVDFYPFVFVLIFKGLHKRLNMFSWLLLIMGTIVNLWGVLWINKFGWISY